jgi:nucleotide-binding universal stress UspA family protein
MGERGRSGRGRRPVAVGVDASASAREAALWAAALALHRNVALEILHVAPVETFPRWLTALRDEAELRGAAPARCWVLTGSVLDQLIEWSQRAALLVVGSRGQDAGLGTLPGATTLELLERAACPVAVVRGAHPQAPPPEDGPVVVGVDAESSGGVALEWAAHLAAAGGSRLVVVHARSNGCAAEAAEVLRRWVAPVTSHYPEMPVDCRVVPEAPLSALLHHSAGARLVVVGHRGATTARGVLGSTARGLVRSAPCPVIVLGPSSAGGGDGDGGPAGAGTFAPARDSAAFLASSP